MTSTPLLFTRDLTSAGLPADALERGVRRGDLMRVSRGAFLGRDAWQSLDERERYRLRITAVAARLDRGTVFSHESAAALWGFPVLDSWPEEVHCLDPARTTGKRSPSLVRHPAAGRAAAPLPGPDVRAGLLVTPPAVTAVDVGLAQGFTAATMMFDHGLRESLFTIDDLQRALASRPRARRRREAGGAMRLASALSATPGESISKAEMALLGFPRSTLQQRFDHRDGTRSFCDFFWRAYGVIGEFDGAEKYLAESMRSGKSIDRVILEEKWRDEKLLAQPGVRKVVHWNYAIARTPALLSARLESAGLPRGAGGTPW